MANALPICNTLSMAHRLPMCHRAMEPLATPHGQLGLNAEDVVKKLCCAGLLERAKNKHWQLASLT